MTTDTACVLAALALAVVTLGRGDYPLGPVEVIRALTGGGDPAADFVVNELRLPRAVTALLAGAALALSGPVLQVRQSRHPRPHPGAATGALPAVAVGAGRRRPPGRPPPATPGGGPRLGGAPVRPGRGSSRTRPGSWAGGGP
ncbi:iron chelate uptake ABC transporter family permease subunit [Streptomyces sp. BE303]|uniref:iron chelate uptake ABC transporter family permease subunit n=1 Tax=Streptomyces sp. BE303 TaxID=3002528 RepID=UPI002E76CCF5|nr:iron chelate uptake ABC transporter family permease subunit [Streptomyces sp. BE303]MED7951318.1 iron chelate uptake ABC transporter family permease subunit [Streptomyces sp. BE303]